MYKKAILHYPDNPGDRNEIEACVAAFRGRITMAYIASLNLKEEEAGALLRRILNENSKKDG